VAGVDSDRAERYVAKAERIGQEDTGLLLRMPVLRSSESPY
jgi:hypothetical protein